MRQETSRRDKTAATVVSSIMPAFQAGGKGKESERKEISFLESHLLLSASILLIRTESQGYP